MNASRTTRGRARGFTLLEMLVAVSVLAVALVSLLGLHARNLRLAAEAEDMTVAGLLASSLAAEIRAGPLPEEGLIEGRFGNNDTVGGDLNEKYGGSLGARFLWRRRVVSLDPLQARAVRITVATVEGPVLAELDFVMRRGGL